MNFPLSIFENTFDTIGKQTFLEKELSEIKSGSYKSQIQNCRHALLVQDNKDLYKKYKSNLKAVTFCGFFQNGRRLNNLVNYNKLIVIDIDGLIPDEVQNLKSKLITDKYILALWVSPSSLGLKGLIKIDSTIETHKAYFSSLSIYFLQTYGVELDKSGSDITRLCYVSWDDNLFVNYDSEIFNILLELSKNSEVKKKDTTIAQRELPNLSLSKSAFATEGLNKSLDRAEIKKIIKFLTGKQISITNSYPEWIKVAVIIANSFSFDVGESYFLALCRIDSAMHDEYKSRELIKFCYNNRNLNHANRITFSTLIYLASLKGYIKR